MTEQFRITRMYHPSFHAPDLGEVEAWFERVFGCHSTNIFETFKGRETGNYPTNYSTFTPMGRSNHDIPRHRSRRHHHHRLPGGHQLLRERRSGRNLHLL